MGMNRPWVWAATGILLVVVIYLLKPILTPFVIAAGLAYLGDPIVDRLQTWKLSRELGVSIVFVVLALFGILVLLLAVPLLEQQIRTLLANLPGYLNRLQQFLQQRLGFAVTGEALFDIQQVRQFVTQRLSEGGGLSSEFFSALSRSGMVILALLSNLVLIPVVSFYLLRDWDKLVERIDSLLPKRIQPTIRELASEADEVLGAFVRGQLIVMLVLGLFYSLGLWLAGLDLAFLIGMGAGLASFVPYLGVITGLLAAGAAMLMQTQELMPLLWVALVFGIGQMLEGMALTPLLVGDRIGLHPVAVIFAVLAGGQLFGFVGVLMALPVAAVVAVLFRFLAREWLKTDLYLKEK